MSAKDKEFQYALRAFHSQNPINKPWLRDRDPYKIWLLEVIMQQTRMSQGFPYYERIVDAFPTVFDLANTSEDELFSLWRGLGYYSRARNLHFTAKYIVSELKGDFPNNYNDLLKLKGVGAYTAAAIASFAFNEKVAVLDGNAHRVLSRVYGIEKTIQSQTDKLFFQEIANQSIFEKEPALFNQLMMDLGSEICKPQNPICEKCPMTSICVANKKNLTRFLPPPKIRPVLKNRYFHCLFIENNGKIYIEKRNENDIWKGLYQGIVQEGEEIDLSFWNEKGIDISRGEWGEWKAQVLSHQKVWMKISLVQNAKCKVSNGKWVSMSEMEKIAFPRVISKWWENYFRE